MDFFTDFSSEFFCLCSDRDDELVILKGIMFLHVCVYIECDLIEFVDKILDCGSYVVLSLGDS